MNAEQFRIKLAEHEGCKLLALELEWNNPTKEPSTARDVLLDTDVGLRVGHHARDLSGEDQPAFEGYFVKLSSYNTEVSVNRWAELPLYEDDNDLMRVVRGLSDDEFDIYTEELYDIMCENRMVVNVLSVAKECFKATPTQIRKALCCALFGEELQV